MSRYDCNGKVKYPSWAVAAREAKSRRRVRDGGNLQPYHCHTCGYVHLGNSPQDKQKRRGKLKRRAAMTANRKLYG